MTAAVLLVGCRPVAPSDCGSSAPDEPAELTTTESLGFDGYGPKAAGEVAGQPFKLPGLN